MSWRELNLERREQPFTPESAEAEALPLFAELKKKMASLTWVYEGSFRWSISSTMLRVVYEPGERAVFELWHTNGSTELLRRICADCNEQGLVDALRELGITPG